MTVEDDAKWLEWAQRQFAAIAGTDRLIDWQEFKLALKVKKVGSYHLSDVCNII